MTCAQAARHAASIRREARARPRHRATRLGGVSERSEPTASGRSGEGGSAPAGLSAGLEPATLGRKAGAFLVDGILSALVAALFTGPHHPPGNWSLVVFALMYPVFIGFFGESPGMRLLGLRCQGVADGRPIGLGRAALRTVLLVLLVPALLTGPDGRPWHDRIVGSIVLRPL